MKRRCGECTLCCTYLQVTAVDGEEWKKSWTTCKHCLGNKCSIYIDRPEACMDFECLWLESSLVPTIFRPDKVKAFMARSKEGNGLIIYCREKDTKSITRGKNRFSQYVLGMASKIPVVLLTEKGAIPVGPHANRMKVIVA